jgi:hypothetical protein
MEAGNLMYLELLLFGPCLFLISCLAWGKIGIAVYGRRRINFDPNLATKFTLGFVLLFSLSTVAFLFRQANQNVLFVLKIISLPYLLANSPKLFLNSKNLIKQFKKFWLTLPTIFLLPLFVPIVVNQSDDAPYFYFLSKFQNLGYLYEPGSTRRVSTLGGGFLLQNLASPPNIQLEQFLILDLMLGTIITFLAFAFLLKNTYSSLLVTILLVISTSHLQVNSNLPYTGLSILILLFSLVLTPFSNTPPNIVAALIICEITIKPQLFPLGLILLMVLLFEIYQSGKLKPRMFVIPFSLIVLWCAIFFCDTGLIPSKIGKMNPYFIDYLGTNNGKIELFGELFGRESAIFLIFALSIFWIFFVNRALFRKLRKAENFTNLRVSAILFGLVMTLLANYWKLGANFVDLRRYYIFAFAAFGFFALAYSYTELRKRSRAMTQIAFVFCVCFIFFFFDPRGTNISFNQQKIDTKSLGCFKNELKFHDKLDFHFGTSDRILLIASCPSDLGVMSSHILFFDQVFAGFPSTRLDTSIRPSFFAQKLSNAGFTHLIYDAGDSGSGFNSQRLLNNIQTFSHIESLDMNSQIVGWKLGLENLQMLRNLSKTCETRNWPSEVRDFKIISLSSCKTI